MPELAWHAAWFIASIGVQLGFHINVGTDFVPNTRDFASIRTAVKYPNSGIFINSYTSSIATAGQADLEN